MTDPFLFPAPLAQALVQMRHIWTQEWLTCLCVFGGYLVLGATGFGSALVLVPLLSIRWPLEQVVPLVLVLDIGATLFSAGLHFRGIDRRLVVSLLPFLLIGAWLGAQAHGVVNDAILLGLLGLYIVWVGVNGLLHRKPTAAARGVPAPAAGVIFGMIETLLGVVGPIAMIWLSARLEDIRQLRMTLPVVILFTSSIALAMGVSTGKFQIQPLAHWVSALVPFMLVGVWLGNRLADRIKASTLAASTYLLLVASGISAFGHSV